MLLLLWKIPLETQLLQPHNGAPPDLSHDWLIPPESLQASFGGVCPVPFPHFAHSAIDGSVQL
jgi:hypothetical protein